jgi:hypothetical protein
MAPANLIINYEKTFFGLTDEYCNIQITSLRVIIIIIRQFLSLSNSLVSLKSFTPGPRTAISVGHYS